MNDRRVEGANVRKADAGRRVRSMPLIGVDILR